MASMVKIKLYLLMALSLLFLNVRTVIADDDVAMIGEGSYGGTGCPDGTAHVEVDQENHSFRIYLDSFTVVAGYGSGRTLDRKGCSIVVPVFVPPGMSISFISLHNWKGELFLSSGSKATISIEHFFGGGRGPSVQRRISGYYHDQFSMDVNPRGPSLWSPCGQSVNFRINISARVSTEDGDRDEAGLFLGTNADGGQEYQLLMGSCGSR